MELGLLLLILMLAAALRIRGIGFGLPALNDPDEPLFVMTAVEMLRNHSLNPGWFGHPGTITLYCIALISLCVAGAGMATGRYADADMFVGAIYADPSILFLPARMLFAACGVFCVYLTWRLGRRIGGMPTGLIAAAFLAVNAIHIDYSQLIRTDVQASMFILLALMSSIMIVERGSMRDYLLAGVFVGVGCATKWPVAAIVVSPLAAGAYRMAGGQRDATKLLLFAGTSVSALLLASPYLLLDYPAVVRDLAGEARPTHPGSTGGGLIENLAWYLHLLLGGFGLAAVSLAGVGAILLTLRNRRMAIAAIPGVAGFAITISAQALRWERWLVPLLPFVAIMAAYAVQAVSQRARARAGRPMLLAEPLLGLLVILPMLPPVQERARARANDTRQLASSWIAAHVPPGATILVEHAALDLLDGPWNLLFPLGSAGCVDARAMLKARVRYAEVETLRVGRPVVDLSSVPVPKLEGCRAQFAVLTHYDRYRHAQSDFATEWRNYATFTQGARLLAIIEPAAGQRAGPTVHVFQLARPHVR